MINISFTSSTFLTMLPSGTLSGWNQDKTLVYNHLFSAFGNYDLDYSVIFDRLTGSEKEVISNFNVWCDSILEASDGGSAYNVSNPVFSYYNFNTNTGVVVGISMGYGEIVTNENLLPDARRLVDPRVHKLDWSLNDIDFTNLTLAQARKIRKALDK